RLVGMDPLTLPNSFAVANISFARSMIELEQSNTLFTNEETALKLPSNVKVTLDPSVGPGLAVGDISLVQRLLKSDRLTRLIILPMQPIKQGDLDTIAPNLRLQKAQQLSDVTKLTDSFHLNLTAFGLLSFAVGLFIVHSTIGLAFEQRRAMIRTMRAMGVPLRTLLVLVNVEMLILAMIGAMIGIVLSDRSIFTTGRSSNFKRTLWSRNLWYTSVPRRLVAVWFATCNCWDCYSFIIPHVANYQNATFGECAIKSVGNCEDIKI
ncbi:MAG: ABC transporter permease, partial [Paracoccaceae bacterium]|nr:ABC transporter permease [Paracoccaceae bacterium]